MSQLQLFLFGRFRLQCDAEPWPRLEGQKVQELLCYLLVHREQFHCREKLAAILWENSSEAQAKQYLRRTLWQLQSAINPGAQQELNLIVVDDDWLQINAAANSWCDVAQFEDAFRAAEGTRGRDLDEETARGLQAAAQLYQGDLLENWYQDWCIVARERLQNMFLMALDKLMSYCEIHGSYEQGIQFGVQILRCDVGRERTYRRLMRLHYLAGDRTGALHRYERCAAVLREEFALEPGRLTAAVYERIKADQPLPGTVHASSMITPGGAPSSLSDLLQYLEAVQASLTRAQRQVTKDIERIRANLSFGSDSKNTP